MSLTAKHITFTGRVQGVGFRFTAMNIADRCGLTGLIRNLPNGSVEMIAQGRPDDITDCIRNIKDTYHGLIRDTTIEDIPPDPRYQDFKITF